MLAPSLDLTGIITADNTPAALGAIARARTLLARALKQDPAAVVRLRAVGERSVDVFISTPLKCAVSTRIPGRTDASDVFLADKVLDALAAFEPGQASLGFGPTMNIRWPGALPPVTGYTEIDTVPAETFRQLHAQMNKENAGTPQGIARSLLEQSMIKVSSEDGEVGVDIHGRIIAAMGGLGAAAQPSSPEMRAYDVVRVSANSGWIRLDTLVASVYTPKPGGLSRVP